MEIKQQAKQAAYCDRDRMTDALSSEKFLSGIYNEALNEGYHAPVKNCFCTLVDDVHRTGEELFSVMNERGWYPVEAAEAQKISAAKMKFAAKS
ncbi:MAG: spore coat protein [Clostridia bacterium]|nr:spore coat protein [Clostridia bacterium]